MTTEKVSNPRYLRLIVENDEKQIKKDNKLEIGPIQLSLGLPEPTAVHFIDGRVADADTFWKAVEKIKPNWIFDVRITPVLSKFAPTRREAFRRFQDLNILYIDVSGRFGIKDINSTDINPAIWGQKLISLVERNAPRKGPFMFLLEDQEMIARLSVEISKVFRNFTTKK